MVTARYAALLLLKAKQNGLEPNFSNLLFLPVSRRSVQFFLVCRAKSHRQVLRLLFDDSSKRSLSCRRRKKIKILLETAATK